MDLASMMKTMLSSDSIAQMSERTGASTDEVKSVLLSALPAMLSGARGQANGRETAAGFAGALESHAKDDTSNVADFLSHVDIQDGEKIVGHLLGGEQAETTKAAATKAGLSTKAAGSILGAAAPLLMSLMGQQITQAVQTQGQGQAQAQAQSVLPLGGGQQAASSGAGLLAGLLGGGQQQASGGQQASGLGGLLGGLFGGGQQQGQQQPSGGQQQASGADANPLGSLVGSLMGSGDVSSLLSGFLGSGK